MPQKLTKQKKKELKTKYASELEILQGMGFTNTSYCIQLLQKKQGDINVVANELLMNPGPDEESSDDEIEESKIIEKEGEFKLDFDQIVKISDTKNGAHKPADRFMHTSTISGENLYCYGGALDNNDFDVLDIEKRTWSCVKPKGDVPDGLSSHTAVEFNGNVYIFGGSMKNVEFSNQLYVFDPNQNTMKKLESAPYGVLGHCACIDEDKMFVFGGLVSSKDPKTTNKLLQYDLSTGEWTEIDVFGDQLESVSFSTMCVVGKHLFIHGGLSSKNVQTSSLFKVSLFNLNCEKIKQENPIERSHATLTKLDENTLLLIGGSSLSLKFNTIHRYLIEEKSWEIDAPDGDFPERSSHTVSYYQPNNLLLIHGGDGKNKIFNTLYYLKVEMKGTPLLINNPSFSDIILKINGKKIYGHKAMFSQTNLKLDENEIKIENVDGNLFMRLVKYLYGKQLIVEGKELLPLIELSRKFEFKELEIHVVNQLRELTPIEILKILLTTEEKVRKETGMRFYSEDLIKALCFEYYQENYEEFNTLECYKTIQKEMDEDLRLELIVSPEIEDEQQSQVPIDIERVQSLCNHLSKLSKKKEFSDLKLISKEGKSFDFHKLLFFGAPFLKNKSSNEIKFDDVDSNVLDIVWKVIYDSTFELDSKSEKKFNKFQKDYNFGFESNLMFPGSKLLKSKYHKIFRKWTGSKKKWKLVYRATKDGWDANDFREKTHEQGPSIVIMQSEMGNIFGGYNCNSWSKTKSGYEFDQRMFLFSIKRTNEESPVIAKLEGPHHSNTYGCYNSTGYGPTWGGGHDLYICSNPNTTNSNYSNFGYAFTCNNLVYGSTEANNFLAGSYNFKLTEMEVFCEK
eukprot:gene3694-6508_t